MSTIIDFIFDGCYSPLFEVKDMASVCLKVTSIFFPSFFFCLDQKIPDEEESGDRDSEGLDLAGSDEDAMSAAEEEECDDDRDSSLAWKKSQNHSGKTPGFSVQSISDFEKFTQGMDDLGSSEEEEDEEEEESGMEEGDGEEDSVGESEEDRAEDRNSEDDGVVMTFSGVRVSEEVEKGRAVKNQIGLYMVLLSAYFSKCLHLISCLFVLAVPSILCPSN